MSAERGTWGDPAIVDDPRIDDQDPVVRAVAEKLHGNESMHLHQDIPALVCVYCALRTSRVLRWAKAVAEGQEPQGDTPWGLIRTGAPERKPVVAYFARWRRDSTNRWSKIHWFRPNGAFSKPACGIEVPEDNVTLVLPAEPILTCAKCKRLNLKMQEGER